MTATDLVKPAIGGARVLVAAGSADDSATLTALLRLNGFDAREARTAEDAFRVVVETRPAILITDLDLPDGGEGALIRRVVREPDPPAVVVVTAHTGETARLAAVRAGAVAFLLKPANPVELIRLVTQLCVQH